MYVSSEQIKGFAEEGTMQHDFMQHELQLNNHNKQKNKQNRHCLKKFVNLAYASTMYLAKEQSYEGNLTR